MFATLIDAAQLAAYRQPRWRLFDCRFDLHNPQAGAARFAAGHIRGAAYLHLERDLSGPVEAGRTGRHPLPDRDAFRSAMQVRGVDANTQVVAYDDSGGLFAARLWWMLRWAGHAAAAVLDGGYAAWLAHRDEPPKPSASAGLAADPSPKSVSLGDIRASIETSAWTLLDARANDRFHGRNETIDAKGGHIPGALNAPFQDNLDSDGKFLDPYALRRRFESLLAAVGDKPVVCYCGSGVSAAHNILAMTHAGMAEPALYAGSWSEWITEPANPVET